jgi:hypothetical protein
MAWPLLSAFIPASARLLWVADLTRASGCYEGLSFVSPLIDLLMAHPHVAPLPGLETVVWGSDVSGHA